MTPPVATRHGLKSWVWTYFHDSGNKYKGDGTHHEARCLGCIREREKLLVEQQQERLDLGTVGPDQLKSAAALRKEAIRGTPAIRGKVETMKRHVKTCENVDQQAKDELTSEEIKKKQVEAQVDTDTDHPTASSSAPNPRQTFFKIAQSKPFSQQKQREFEHDFLKLLVVMNVAWLAANDPFVKHFFETWVPGARLPDRKQLSTRVLNAEVARVTSDVAKEVNGQYATGTVDGWSTKKDAIQCTGLNVNGKEYPGQIHVTTPERKTSAQLLTHVLADIAWMVQTLGVILVAWCCDSGGDSHGLRPLLLAVMPWLLTIACWAHQINLVVYDYVHRAGDWIAETLNKCATLTNWFTSHKRALSLLLDEERKDPAKWPRLKSFIRAAITRWTTHYLSVHRLSELSPVLRTLAILRREDLLLAGGDKRDQIDAATDVVEIIEDSKFWQDVNTIKIYLEPLALAANVAQGSSTRLDHVLLTLATLHHTYSSDTRTFPNLDDNATILASLEKRWTALKHDQDFYIVAVFLNPYLRAHFFNDSAAHSLSRAGLYAVLKRVYQRVFRIDNEFDVPGELFSSYCLYYDGEGRYTGEGFALKEWKKIFEGQDTIAFLQSAWKSLPKKDLLRKLALVIMSIVANSAGTECHFSKLGHIYQDKHRSLTCGSTPFAK